MKFEKGHKLATGRPKGSLNKETINKLERRAIFEKEVEAMFIETIKKARPEYLLDQFLGKAPDIIEGMIKTEPSERLKLIAKMLKDATKDN
jgi:hypothetical protein